MHELSPEVLERISQVVELPIDLIDFNEVRSVVLEVQTPHGYRQWIGPFPSGDMAVLEAMLTLKLEESEAQDEPNQYFVRPLLPPSAAIAPC